MKSRSILGTATLTVGAIVLGTTPAFATTMPIPEPSMLGIYGGGVAALVIAARWLRRK